jgi:hypothetical protein
MFNPAMHQHTPVQIQDHGVPHPGLAHQASHQFSQAEEVPGDDTLHAAEGEDADEAEAFLLCRVVESPVLDKQDDRQHEREEPSAQDHDLQGKPGLEPQIAVPVPYAINAPHGKRLSESPLSPAYLGGTRPC